jgi:hypothetical protein
VNRAKGGIESVHPLVQRGQRIEKANYSLMRKASDRANWHLSSTSQARKRAAIWSRKEVSR